MVALHLMGFPGFDKLGEIQEYSAAFSSSKVHKEVKVVLEVL